MRIILASFLLLNALHAQELSLGIVERHNSPQDDWTKSIDIQFASGHRLGGVAQFETRRSWVIGSRANMVKTGPFQWFLQDAIRDNVLQTGNLKRRAVSHPWVLQTGIGFDARFKRERVLAVASATDRLKTIQSGYVFSFNNFYSLGHDVDFRATYVRGRSLNESSQLGFGFDYTFHFKR